LEQALLKAMAGTILRILGFIETVGGSLFFQGKERKRLAPFFSLLCFSVARYDAEANDGSRHNDLDKLGCALSMVKQACH